MEKKLMVSLLLEFYGQLLSDKQREIMEYYYNDDLSLSEIAGNIGITRQGVHDTIHRVEIQLNQWEDKLGLYKRFQQIEASLDKIEIAVNEMENLYENDDIKAVKEKSRYIKSIIDQLR